MLPHEDGFLHACTVLCAYTVEMLPCENGFPLMDTVLGARITCMLLVFMCAGFETTLLTQLPHGCLMDSAILALPMLSIEQEHMPARLGGRNTQLAANDCGGEYLRRV